MASNMAMPAVEAGPQVNFGFALCYRTLTTLTRGGGNAHFAFCNFRAFISPCA